MTNETVLQWKNYYFEEHGFIISVKANYRKTQQDEMREAKRGRHLG
jgi:hypothetical protein